MKNIFFALLFLVIGCGRESVHYPDAHLSVTAVTGIKSIILAFGAPWCGPCHTFIPKIQEELDKLPAEKQKKIEFRVYVVTGKNPGDLPTQAIADYFVKKDLKIDAIPVPDPKWSVFRSIISKSLSVPAGAVLDADGKLLQRYLPGEQFNPAEIVRFAASR